jgi:hypothetical protein
MRVRINQQRHASTENVTWASIAGEPPLLNPLRQLPGAFGFGRRSFPICRDQCGSVRLVRAGISGASQPENSRWSAGDLPNIPTDILQNTNLANLTNFRNGERVNTSQAPKATLLFSPRVGFNWM